jgi:hypothetical protein
MSRFPRRWLPPPAAAGLRAWRGTAAFGAMAAVLAIAPLPAAPGQAGSRPPPAVPVAAGTVQAGTVPAGTVPPGAGPASGLAGIGQAKGSGFRQIVLPDLAVIEPHGLSVTQVTALRKLRGVSDVLAVDGAAIKARGRQVNVVGVNPQQFRSWTPLATASDQRLWAALAGGDFVASGGAGSLLRLHKGARYQLVGAAPLPALRWRRHVRDRGRRPGGQRSGLRLTRAHPQRRRPRQRARRGDAHPQA